MSKEHLPPLPDKAPGIPPKDRYKRQFGVLIIAENEQQQATIYDGVRALAGAKLKVVAT